MDQDQLDLARRLAGLFAALPEVEAVALGGSRASDGVGSDDLSDIDLYVYTRADIPMAARRQIVERAGGASRADLGLDYWGAGDEWLHGPTGTHVDAIYFEAGWMEEQVDRSSSATGVPRLHDLLLAHGPPVDRPPGRAGMAGRAPGALEGGLPGGAAPEHRCPEPPGAPRRPPRLGRPAGEGGAARRPDQRQPPPGGAAGELLRHRLRRQPPAAPGEKRLLDAAVRTCPRLPVAMADDVTEILRTATTDLAGLPARVGRLLDRLDALLADEGLAGQR